MIVTIGLKKSGTIPATILAIHEYIIAYINPMNIDVRGYCKISVPMHVEKNPVKNAAIVIALSVPKTLYMFIIIFILEIFLVQQLSLCTTTTRTTYKIVHDKLSEIYICHNRSSCLFKLCFYNSWSRWYIIKSSQIHNNW